MAKNIYTEITPRMLELADMTKKADIIDSELFTKDDVKPYYNNNGILIINLFDFLLNEDILNY